MLLDDRIDEAIKFIREMSNAKSIDKVEVMIFLDVLTKIKELLLSNRVSEAMEFIEEEINTLSSFLFFSLLVIELLIEKEKPAQVQAGKEGQYE